MVSEAMERNWEPAALPAIAERGVSGRGAVDPMGL
jgi:hypothetical protein